MNQIWTTRELVERGFTHAELARLVRAGSLAKIRPGAYELPTAGTERRPADQHRALILATAAQLGPGAVVSHGSAAVLHRLPTWTDERARVHITRSRGSGARTRRLVQVHGATLTPADVVVVDGVAVTSVARTVLDLARTVPFEQAVAAGDRALAAGLDRLALDGCLDRMIGWPGSRQAQRVADFLDPLSESAGESVSRVRCWEEGLPAPQLQYVIRDAHGRQIARCDFAWEEYRTVGEFDGKVKYGELLRPGETAADAVLAERRRKQAIRDQGWQVARWLWEDLYRPGAVETRLRRQAFRLAAA